MPSFKKVEFTQVAAKLQQAPMDGLPEVVLAGRSNAGKSSLINALAQRRQLAKVSATPGKTRLVVYFKVDDCFYLTDLPGYGYAKVSRAVQEKFSDLAQAYFDANRPIALVLLLLDIRHEPSKFDRQMYEYLLQSGQDFALILAKADKLSRSAGLQRKREILKDLNAAQDIPCFIVSASQKKGIDELRDFLISSFTEERPNAEMHREM